MKTPLPNPPAPPTHPGPVAIPLTPDVRAAYQALYDANETLIKNSADPAVLEPCNDIHTDVGNILTKDNMYRLEANTALFQALLTQIKSTNAGLSDLKKQIQAVASNIAEAAAVVGAIEKVVSVISG